MRDVLVHAGTGLGKTAIAAGPHAHPSSEGKVTLMISPLIALHDEQVNTFREEFKLAATAVNSSNGGCTIEVLAEIMRGHHQIVLISPEMALSRRFVEKVLQNADFGRRILSVVVDEAHVVSHWGAQFRKKYGTLGTIRAHLPRGTPIVALSATLPIRVQTDVLSKLQFGKDYQNIDVGNDRDNVSIIVRSIQHPMNTYADLDFTVKKEVENAEGIPKTFVYADNIATGVEIIDHLTSLLPPNLRSAGTIRPYNAAFSKAYRKEVMNHFKEGRIRILVCTDAAGIAKPKRKKTVAPMVTEQDRKRQTQQRKEYAKLHGGQDNAVLTQSSFPLDPEAADEGLYVLVQAGTCRRLVLTEIYNNKRPCPIVPCCDICCPALLDLTRPGSVPAAASRETALRRAEPNRKLQYVLHQWREAVKEREFPSPMFPSTMVLSDDAIDVLAGSPFTFNSVDQLARALGAQCTWIPAFASELLAHLITHHALLIRTSTPLGMESQLQQPPQRQTDYSVIDDKNLPDVRPAKRVQLVCPANTNIRDSVITSGQSREGQRRGSSHYGGGNRGCGKKKAQLEDLDAMKKAFETADDPRMANLFSFSMPRGSPGQQGPDGACTDVDVTATSR
ncbi:P-loop containing nucleoside triphosphate hydrolase protein [Armillaria luteobubalina]|uniref:DNA 3'-5' helicase n=1 Tax=Armillaria luteobubalina TaxID=153913 RepID=A0AA39PLU8_9AGAR|nr:P-loop containing nucleoside triphosphate hydrolase protein [Armillaria luteobubalina]